MFSRKTPKVSIIIPSYFRPNQDGKIRKGETFWFASHCLKKLIERTPKTFYEKDGTRDFFEIILIDNGSSMGEDEGVIVKRGDYGDLTYPAYSLEEYFSKGNIVVVNKTNLGYGSAMNQGINLARGEYICLANNDLICWSGWLEALLNVFEIKSLYPSPGIVMPALMKETKDPYEALMMETINLKNNYGKYSPKAEFGSCWLMKKELVDKIKQQRSGYYFFDEYFLCGMSEDREIYDRVRELGFETYRTHCTRMYHLGNLTIGKITDRKKYTFANRIYLAKLRELEKQGKKPTDEERKKLREDADKELEEQQQLDK